MPKPNYYHELNTNAEVLKERVTALEQKVDETRLKLDEIVEIGKETAVLKQQIAEQAKRMDE